MPIVGHCLVSVVGLFVGEPKYRRATPLDVVGPGVLKRGTQHAGVH